MKQHPDPFPHRIYIDLKTNTLTAFKDRNQSIEINLTGTVLTLLTEDVKNLNLPANEKKTYLDIIDFCIGDDLQDLEENSNN